MVMLSMRKTAFHEFAAHQPRFPKPIIVGKSRRGKPILRYKKEQILAFIELSEAATE